LVIFGSFIVSWLIVPLVDPNWRTGTRPDRANSDCFVVTKRILSRIDSEFIGVNAVSAESDAVQ